MFITNFRSVKLKIFLNPVEICAAFVYFSNFVTCFVLSHFSPTLTSPRRRLHPMAYLYIGKLPSTVKAIDIEERFEKFVACQLSMTSLSHLHLASNSLSLRYGQIADIILKAGYAYIVCVN